MNLTTNRTFSISMDYDLTISQEGIFGALKTLKKTWRIFFKHLSEPGTMIKEFSKLDLEQRREAEKLKRQITIVTQRVNDLRESDYKAAQRQGLGMSGSKIEPLTDEQVVDSVLKGAVIPFYTTSYGHRIEALQKELDRKLLEYVKLSETGLETMSNEDILVGDEIPGVGLAEDIPPLDAEAEEALDEARQELEEVRAEAEALEEPIAEAVREGRDEEEAIASTECFYAKRLLINRRLNKVRETVGLESMAASLNQDSRANVQQTLTIINAGLKASRESILPGHEVDTHRGTGVVSAVITQPFVAAGKQIAASTKAPRYRVSFEGQRDVIFSGEALRKTGAVRQVQVSQEGVLGFLLGTAKGVGGSLAGVAVGGALAGPVGAVAGKYTGGMLVDNELMKKRLKLKKEIEEIAQRIVQARDGDFKAAMAKGSKPTKAELDTNDVVHAIRWAAVGQLIPFYSGYQGHKIEQLQEELADKIKELELLFETEGGKTK